MVTLLIATRNAHKVGEIATILGPQFCCLTLADYPGAPAAIEDADTFFGNATKKANCLAQWLAFQPDKLPAPFFILADDSGLEVDALNGAPGVHSARFAAVGGPGHDNTPDAANNAKLLSLLEHVPAAKRTARFRCVIALQPLPGHEVILFDGVCAGAIKTGPSGQGGFGYDPLFVPDGHAQSFADLGESIKNRLSHRAQALEKLRHYFAVNGA